MAPIGRADRRPGASSQVLLAATAGTIVLPLVGWLFLENWWGGAKSGGPLTCAPIRGTFTHEIVQKGTIDCASNVEVKCEVDARGFYSTNILEVVPEGTRVEAGDFLLQLDSSPLEELAVRQQIVCNEYEAALIRTETWLETCKVSLQEYVDGLLPRDEQKLGHALDRAKEKLRQATVTLEASEAMFRRGYVTQIALEADEYAAEKARVEFETAQTKLEVLKNYKSKKRLNDLQSYLAVAEASLRWRRHIYDLAVKELESIKQQIAKCTITAPSAGQVVHGNIYHNGHSHLIEPGAFVWRNRVLILLPNSTEMHATVHVPETKVVQVRKGQKVRIRCEAFPAVELTGAVQLIDEFPAPTDYWGPQMKCYKTLISIDRESIVAAGVNLRPGLTADITIEVDEQAERMMVPLQAVLKHGGKSYCLTHDRSGFHPHEVETGATNGKFVVIHEGLADQQELVLGAANYRGEVDLPELERR